jgi:hypothetical protein
LQAGKGRRRERVRVVRIGGQYLEEREQGLWLLLTMTLAFTAVALMMLVGNYGTSLMWFGLPPLLASIPLGRVVVRRLSSVRKGRLGERLVISLLRRLPDDYWLINDVTLEGGRGNIDHVLVGPCGVVVIETKRLAGHIRCSGDDWYVNGYPRKSVSEQVKSAAIAVRHFLAERHPQLAPTWVESIIVFTHPLCRLKIDRARAIVVRYSELLKVVLELAEKHCMPPKAAARLAQTLLTSQREAPPSH